MGSYFDAIKKVPLLGPIASVIKKNNKISELKDLRARGDLSTDEFSTMKNLVMYGSGESVEFEYFKRGTFSSLESSLKDYWKGKTDSKDYFAERHKSFGSGIRFSKSLSRPSQTSSSLTVNRSIMRKPELIKRKDLIRYEPNSSTVNISKMFSNRKH